MDRITVRAVIATALEPLDFVRAAWEGGSPGFGHEDEWSDLDMLVLVHEEHTEAVFDAVYAAIEELGGIEAMWRLPDPTWHGHPQAFIRPAGAPEHLLVDLVVMAHDTDDPGLELEVHGAAVVVFDKDGIVTPVPFDREAERTRMRERLAMLRTRVDLFGHFADKEAARGNLVGAIDELHSIVLNALYEVLRMRYVPDRSSWSTRYLRRDLPGHVADRLDALWAVNTLADIPGARAEATRWFEAEADAL